ncbi:MAG: AtpZ/AtpI family protein [Lachnospiraceae bacterium]|nr:AtpZ/AtpI family protein [Lachnospiraceae bacterium]
MKYRKTVYQALATVSQFGINMLVPIFLCSFLGIFLDRKLGTSYCMVFLFFVGALAGFRNVFLLAKRIYSNSEERTAYGGKGRKDKEDK